MPPLVWHAASSSPRGTTTSVCRGDCRSRSSGSAMETTSTPRCYWFLDNEGLNCDHSMGYAHNASLFRRAAFEGVGGYPPVSLGADGALDAPFSGLAHAVDPLRKDKELRRSEWFFPPVSSLVEGLRSRNPPAAGHPRGTPREAARLSTGTQAYRRLRRPTRGGHRTWITSGRPLSTTPTR